MSDRSAAAGHRPLPDTARDRDQALGMLRAAMDADQVWPDLWFITDHGNPHRLDPDQP